jgi:hypothetical protein
MKKGALSDAEITGLAALGHQLKAAPYPYGDMQAVLLNKTTKALAAASDKRGEGRALVNVVDLKSAEPSPEEEGVKATALEAVVGH